MTFPFWRGHLGPPDRHGPPPPPTSELISSALKIEEHPDEGKLSWQYTHEAKFLIEDYDGISTIGWTGARKDHMTSHEVIVRFSPITRDRMETDATFT